MLLHRIAMPLVHAGVAIVAVLAAPVAHAQWYGDDPVAGAVIGGGAGAAIGGALGGREGAIVGGALGAVVGASSSSGRTIVQVSPGVSVGTWVPPGAVYYPPQPVYVRPPPVVYYPAPPGYYAPPQAYYPPPQVYYPPQRVYVQPPAPVYRSGWNGGYPAPVYRHRPWY